MYSTIYLVIFVTAFHTLYRGTLALNRQTFLADNLKCHNKYRARHQVSNLQYTPELQGAAQKYADELAKQDRGLVHEKGTSFGENLYYSFGSEVSGKDACEAWYSENTKYNYNRKDPSNFSQVGHFTQLVWKGTTITGIGYAKSKSGKTYIVAKYSPPGNFMGEYKQNVLTPKA